MFGLCSPSQCGGADEIADARRIKDGELLRYKQGFFGSKWVKCYVVLLSDARLLIFNSSSDSKATEYFKVEEALPMMCVGLMCDRLRARRPSLPADSSIHHLVGISLDKQGEKAYWLLFPSDAELEDWLEQIAKMMPRPEQPNLGPVPPQMPNTMGQPLPPPGHHVVAPLPGGYQNQPPAYGQPGAPTTIIVQGDQQRGGGMGFAGGMALGALAGYGFGSFFPPAISEVGGPPATPAAAPEAAPDAAAAPPPPDPAVNEPPAAQPETFYLGEESAPVFEQPAEPVGFGGFGGDEYGAFDDGGEF